MAQRSHVPKFGNWDGDNVPYTAYFENARKEKAGGISFNPNDPEQNPEAFSNGISPNNGTYEQQKQKQKQKQKEKGGGGSSTSSSDTCVLKPKHQRKKSHRTKSNADTTNPSLPDADDFSYRSVSVPKFGQWDENDPRSAEGFTVIFNKVKEEKQIAASNPPVPLHTTNNYEATQERHTRKKCCCLF